MPRTRLILPGALAVVFACTATVAAEALSAPLSTQAPSSPWPSTSEPEEPSDDAWRVSGSETVGPGVRFVDVGLVVEPGGTLRLEGSMLRMASGTGILVRAGGVLVLADGDGHGASIGPQAPGADVALRVEGTLRAVGGAGHVIEGITNGTGRIGAITLSGKGALAELRTTTLRDNAFAAIVAGDGARLLLTDVTLVRPGRVGLLVAGGATAMLDRVTSADASVAIEATQSTVHVDGATLSGASGAVRASDADVSIRGGTLSGRVGAWANGGTLRLDDVRVERYVDAGLVAANGASVEVRGGSFDGGRAAPVGVLAHGAGEVLLERVVVRAHATAAGIGGDGVRVADSGGLVARDLFLHDNAGWGLRVDGTPHEVDGDGRANGLGAWSARADVTALVERPDGAAARGALVHLVEDQGAGPRTATADASGRAGPWRVVAVTVANDGRVTTPVFTITSGVLSLTADVPAGAASLELELAPGAEGDAATDSTASGDGAAAGAPSDVSGDGLSSSSDVAGSTTDAGQAARRAGATAASSDTSDDGALVQRVGTDDDGRASRTAGDDAGFDGSTGGPGTDGAAEAPGPSVVLLVMGGAAAGATGGAWMGRERGRR